MGLRIHVLRRAISSPGKGPSAQRRPVCGKVCHGSAAAIPVALPRQEGGRESPSLNTHK